MSKLPTSWKQYLDSMPLEDIHHLLNFSEYKQNIVCPLSLLCIKILLRYLNLPRKLISKNNFSQNDQCIEKNKVDLSNMNTDSVKEVPVLFKYPKLWNLFLKHVKSKKRYEIFQIAEKTAEVANRLNVTYIVDIGSGLGHLSRILAYGFNLKVCSIETQQKLTQQAL